MKNMAAGPKGAVFISFVIFCKSEIISEKRFSFLNYYVNKYQVLIKSSK